MAINCSGMNLTVSMTSVKKSMIAIKRERMGFAHSITTLFYFRNCGYYQAKPAFQHGYAATAKWCEDHEVKKKSKNVRIRVILINNSS